MKRKVIIGVLLIIVVGGAIVYRMYSKQRADVSGDKPDITIAAGDLIAAVEKDTAAARKQYVDKVIEVTGNVKRIDTSGAVILGEEGSVSEVVIGLDSRYTADIGKLKVGSTATLQGICSGFDKAGGDPDDLLASLGGTTVQLWSASVKNKK